jgi:hypothetical protein
MVLKNKTINHQTIVIVVIRQLFANNSPLELLIHGIFIFIIFGIFGYKIIFYVNGIRHMI